MGAPNRGLTSQRRRAETVQALSLVVGNTPIHPENVHTRTRKYLTHLTVGMWVKSSCQSIPRRKPLAQWVGKGVCVVSGVRV